MIVGTQRDGVWDLDKVTGAVFAHAYFVFPDTVSDPKFIHQFDGRLEDTNISLQIQLNIFIKDSSCPEFHHNCAHINCE